MSQVTLNVKVTRQELDKLQSDINNLQGKTIHIKTEGTQQAAQQTQQVTGALKEYDSTLEKAVISGGKLVKSVRETDLAEGQVIKTQKTYNLEMGQTATVTNTVSKATLRLTTTLKDTAKASKVSEQGITSAIAQTTGLGASFKSAADSASVFINKGLTPMEKALNNSVPVVKQTSQGLKYEYAPAIKDAAEATEKANLSWRGLGEAFVKFTQWYLIAGAVTGVISELKAAVTEMKNVDTALITVQRTMGATKEEMQGLADGAYDTAARLGTTASNYLNTVAEFAKAGYREQAEELGELSVMLEKVGDTTADVANQFLLSVDKAYQFNGSIAELTKVMDGVNLIGNRFATSVDKVAAGLGTVAPVAAQAHVSVEELTAAIGTITAVTQRSGAEAARALRALFLNIMGDTKTEIDEGVTWTTGEIAGLRDVINTYAADVVAAADATGTLINPMEAIAALAKSMQDGVLSEQKLMEMVSDIGGKLRTSQLLALIQNWDMYQGMLTTYADAAGTAAEEYSVYLDSWEAKTQQLSATWTQLVSNIISSDEIKLTLDTIIKLVEALDTPVGRLAIKIGITAAAIGIMSTAVKSLASTQLAAKVVGFFMLLTSGADGATIAISQLTAAMLANPLFWAAGVGAAAYGYVQLIDALNVSYEEQTEIVRELNAEYEKQFGRGSEYDDLVSRVDSLTEAEKARLEVLKAQNDAMKERIALENDKAFAAFQDEEQGARGLDGARGRSNASIALEEIENAMAGGGTKEGLSTVIEAYREYYDTLVAFKGENRELTDDQEKVIEQYEEATVALNALSKAQDSAANAVHKFGYEQNEIANETIIKLKSVAEMASEASDGYSTLASAEGEVAQYGTVTASTLSTLLDKYPHLIEYLTLTENGYVLTKDALNAFSQAQMASITGADKVINAEALKKAGYDTTTMSILQQLNAMRALYQAQYYNRMLMEGHTDAYDIWQESYGSSAEAAAIAQIDKAIRNVENYTTVQGILRASGTGSGTGRGGRSGSSSSSTSSSKDPELTRLASIVSLRKSELTLMQAQNRPAGEQIAKMREIQAALHDQAEYLRKIGGSQEDINKLSTEWLGIQDDIKKLQDNLWSELENAVNNQLKAAADVRDRAIDALDKELERLEAERDAKEKAVDLDQKQNDLLEARIALQNALNERTVRYYNSATGQWEWGANSKNVKSAQDALTKAEQALADYQADLSYEAQKQQIEARKQAINDQYDALENSWGRVTGSLQKPTRDIAAILKDIAQNGTPQMKQAVENVAGLLNSLGVYMDGLGVGGNALLPTSSSNVHKTANSSTVYRVTTDAGRTAAQNMVAGTSWTDTAGYVWTKNTDGSMVAEKNGKIYNIEVYDDGGILSGLGGIKATREDEMILPPDITNAMLDPKTTALSRQRLAELRYLYGVDGASIGAGSIDNRVGSVHNGNVYTFGNITLSESQASVMTVKELARLSRGLRTYNAN